jgi:hypothetical protein
MTVSALELSNRTRPTSNGGYVDASKIHYVAVPRLSSLRVRYAGSVPRANSGILPSRIIPATWSDDSINLSYAKSISIALSQVAVCSSHLHI